MCRKKGHPRGKYPNGTWRCDGGLLNDARRALGRVQVALIRRPGAAGALRREEDLQGEVEWFEMVIENRDSLAQTGFDLDGYDREGYDKDGYDRNGFDREGSRSDGSHFFDYHPID